MKMIFDKQTNTLMDPTYMLIGDVDPLMNTSKRIEEILSQNRPLVQKDVETEEQCEGASLHPEQSLVWICYITDNRGNAIVVKAVSTKKKAREWLSDGPHTIGKKDDEVRGHRFVESYVLELEVE